MVVFCCCGWPELVWVINYRLAVLFLFAECNKIIRNQLHHVYSWLGKTYGLLHIGWHLSQSMPLVIWQSLAVQLIQVRRNTSVLVHGVELLWLLVLPRIDHDSCSRDHDIMLVNPHLPAALANRNFCSCVSQCLNLKHWTLAPKP